MTDGVTDGVARRRVLVAVLVYNGRAFVPRTLTSLAALRTSTRHHDVDVVVLDDASPEPGWSDELASLSCQLELGYYCSPRNLGIPRNMNLGLLLAEDQGYDYVVILNSDVVVPGNMIDQMVAAAASASDIGTVTAWSNSASIFSIPNEVANDLFTDQVAVDDVSNELADAFGDEVLDLPVGVGFCLMIARETIAAVGLFDPVFGRGYCEEVDLCRRTVAVGLRNVLALGVFVFHMGSATTVDAGLLQPGEKTVHVNEDIIDQRHPDYRAELQAWVDDDRLAPALNRALARLVSSRARSAGYVLEASWLRRQPVDGVDKRVRIAIDPDGVGPLVEALVDGWRTAIPVDEAGILAGVSSFVGCAPDEVRIHDRGLIAERLAQLCDDAGVSVVVRHRYPERV